MITRAGVTVMDERTKNVSIAKETIGICKEKQYILPSGQVIDLSDSLNKAIKGTALYLDEAVFTTLDGNITPTIEVTNETTAEAAVRLAALGKTDLVALNFASAKNQGGGFLSGSIAQEEDLCRASGLYPCLLSKPMYYSINNLCDTPLYTDAIIYSPKVPFFRDSYKSLLYEPFELSIITSPAPCLRNIAITDNLDEDVLYTTIYNRAKKILQVAAYNGHKSIILGAWGCGAFGNSAEVVSQIFKEVLAKVPLFEHVCFAVYDIRPETPVFNIFKETLS